MLKLVFDANFSLIFATIPAQKANAKIRAKFKSANKGDKGKINDDFKAQGKKDKR